ncbi:MAG: hypothetical protein E7580_00590 [Ruminococcaceae bacterium]|nr:hypothetical protein [Oscillospiraceae bacterium]
MKKLISLSLCLLMLLPLFAGCESGDLSQQEPKKETAEVKKSDKSEEEKKNLPDIPEENRLSAKKLAQFPIANSSMTEEELRNLCVEFFRFSQTFAWTPDEAWSYTIGSSTTKHTLAPGTVYGGFPYLHGAGNVYRMLEFYDEETGEVNMKEAGMNQRYFGNFCSYGSAWGFSRVINSASHKLTQNMVPAEGYIPIGPYKMNTELKEFPENETVAICTGNGEQTMFESYACLKPADALVYYTTGGHIIMCSSVHVERNADNTINGEASYITFIDQATAWWDGTLANGNSYRVQGGVDKKATFAKLFKSAYIPYTFAEFQGTDPVEPGIAALDTDKTELTLQELIDSNLTANYIISDVHIHFIGSDGKTVDTKVIRTGYGGILSVELSKGVFAANAKKYADGKHTVRITCQMGNGEKITAWEGKLLAE